jgi:hypothetical protein
MKTLIPAILILLSPLCCADEGAIESAKTHLKGSLKSNHKELAATYAPKVKLMPGHEFLKEDYGLVGAGARAEGAEVERDKLIAAMEKAAAGRPARPAERVDGLLETLKYEVLKVKAGKGQVDPTDPVGTPDGKLHFEVKEGDVLLKVSPPKGDFLYLHLRKVDGNWLIVSEYLD